ncbi:unnamed protein product [Aphanomyces euteiches]
MDDRPLLIYSLVDGYYWMIIVFVLCLAGCAGYYVYKQKTARLEDGGRYTLSDDHVESGVVAQRAAPAPESKVI